MATEKKTNKYTEETYDITLPLTTEKQDDVTVIINGFATKIKRGEPVTVSAAVYEVLKNSEKMDTLALQRRMKISKKD